MKQAVARSWKHLAKERIEDLKPTIPLGSKFWPLKKSELLAIKRLFRTDDIANLPTLLRSRDDATGFDVVDSAYWMKGCSSLGLLRFGVLLQSQEDAADLCLIDIKEAVAAAAPRYKRAKMPRDNAQRIVEGARHLSPHLGERMAAGRLMDRSFGVRPRTSAAGFEAGDRAVVAGGRRHGSTVPCGGSRKSAWTADGCADAEIQGEQPAKQSFEIIGCTLVALVERGCIDSKPRKRVSRALSKICAGKPGVAARPGRALLGVRNLACCGSTGAS